MTSYINTKENEIKNINNLLEQNSNNQQQILKEYDDNYKLKISSFKEQLSQESEETYNKLKICETTLDEANKQIIVLKVEKENLAKLNAKVTKELKNFELEQADTMGHHNHKQKIRHVITLKEENLKLNDELNKVKHDLKKKDQLLKAYEDKMNRLEGKKKFDPKLAFQCHILKEVNENKENIL
ncbi:hyaluronan mediated motility receptor-like [Gordionus sp. m RMFG-2023]|uniref:hyaluronan mediated motility receptor-like n=1 Tax=Gordionus sp. m RMFG-2023 TaxID=3053472 RepID=UPI0031FD8ABA